MTNRTRAGGAGEMADAQVEAAAQAGYEERIRQQFNCEPGASWLPRSGQHTLTWADLPDKIKEQERATARAALAAAQAGATEEQQWLKNAEAQNEEISKSEVEFFHELRWQKGFAAGIETAAKWLEQYSYQVGTWGIEAIRALRPSEPAGPRSEEDVARVIEENAPVSCLGGCNKAARAVYLLYDRFMSADDLEQNKAGIALIGRDIYFAHQPGGPTHRVQSVGWNGMVTIDDMPGEFAPHLFIAAATTEKT
jgi:hypothetical protein